MNRFKTILAMLAFVLLAISCQKDETPKMEYLDVTPNNLAGDWKLVEWKGAPLLEQTYFYMTLVRRDQTFTFYQNFGSIGQNAQVLTGRYDIEYDPASGAVFVGEYDYSSGFFAHSFYVRELTSDSMTWVAVDDSAYVQKFVRTSIPAGLKK